MTNVWRALLWLPRRGLKRFLNRWYDLAWVDDPDPVIGWFGTLGFFWGAILWLPAFVTWLSSVFGFSVPPIYETFGSSPTYGFMAEIAAEWKWGAVLSGSALVKLYVLFFIERSWIKVISNGVMASIWFFVWISVTMSNPASTGVVVYLVFTAEAVWATIRRTVQLLGGK